MKQIIDKITNKDRLVQLYGCSECNGTTRVDNPIHVHNADPNLWRAMDCPNCNGKGYTINRDSQVLDIVELLCTARVYLKCKNKQIIKIMGSKPRVAYLAQALIKLIELLPNNSIEYMEDYIVDDFIKDNTIDETIHLLFMYISASAFNVAFNVLLSFCNHHKIKIWDSVTEILEGEG